MTITHTYPVRAGAEANALILNANGEQVVNLYATFAADQSWGEFANRFAFLAPGQAIGDELFLIATRTASPPWASFDVPPITVGHIASGPNQNPPKFSYGDDVGLALNFPAQPFVGEESGVPLPEPLHPYPSSAYLRWTGAYWLVVAASEGVIVGDWPQHA